ncbi:hypothetical protein GCM10010211_27170 [Streptomyces albospinus]|uniref:Uncharacterized protein n=1 Tax=Streptomyces albospinus TaxID=285515 RepID=A0ABQ2UZ54_9ACTN|nr:hypothetical protein [Streptomyces albospinus]GGU60873.1 hypothetical protein GCM10010211_27170 [Streptomyces albospinus]
MPPDPALQGNPKESQLKRYEANIPRGALVETSRLLDFQVNVRADLQLGIRWGMFLALPFLGNVLVRSTDARWLPAVALATLAAVCRCRLRHQRRRAV